MEFPHILHLPNAVQCLGLWQTQLFEDVRLGIADIRCAFEKGISKHIEKDGMQIPGTSIWNYS